MTRLSPSSLPASDYRQELFCIGASHGVAPVEFREQLTVTQPQWASLLQANCPAIDEWALVITCNRWELYAMACEPVEEAIAQVRQAIGVALHLPNHIYAPLLFTLTRRAAARRLCWVTAGLDSLILGESQIQGQVASAYADALARGSAGPALSALMRTAIRAGRRGRTETAINSRSVTMSSVALAMAEAYAGDLAQRRVVVIGAGEMVRLALKALHSRQVSAVTVVNRTLERAQALRLDSRWEARGLDTLSDAVARADVVFSATRSPGYLLTREMLAALSVEQNRGKVLIDLAVPRDIDPATRQLRGITLIDVDDLRSEMDQGVAVRRQAVPAVEALIESELDSWEQEMRGLSLRPLVVELRLKAEQIRRQEMERTLRFLGDVDDSTRAHLDLLTRALVNKLLHEPTMHIKALAQENDVDQHASAIRAFFGLRGDSVTSHDPHSTV